MRITVFTALILTCVCVHVHAAGGKPGGTPAAPGNPEIKVLNEVQPAGGTVQLKFSVTEPTPISTGTTSTGFDGYMFDSIDGIQLFSATGDVFGVAVLQPGSVQVRYVSPGGTFGLQTDYPVLTIAAHIRDTAPRGYVMPLGSNTTIAASAGPVNYDFLFKPGTLTIGGSVSIQNVLPGGGYQPAGTVIRVLGSGFQKGTSWKSTTRIASTTLVSANEVDMVLAAPASMDGVRFDAKNPDNSTDSYFSYQRGVAQGASLEPVLNTTVPIFSSLTYSGALIAQAPRGITGSILTALAVQNPASQMGTFKLEAFSPLGESLAKTQVALPVRGKIVRELGEYFGITLPENSTVRLSADYPMQVLGLLADKSAGTAAAFAVGR